MRYDAWHETTPRARKPKMVSISQCPEVTALKKDEEMISCSLENANLDLLSQEALEIGAIPQNVRDNVMSMDWDRVPRPRVIRYLLIHVYKAIEDRPRLYERWCCVLSKHVSSVEVLDSHGPMHLAWDNVTTETVIGEKRPQPRNVFTVTHIPRLTEMLTACAGKWAEISIFLGLPEHIRRDLHKIFLMESSISCFNSLLWEWIVGKHSHTKDPTLENLEAALRSKTVELGKEANHLQDNLSSNGIFLVPTEEEPVPRKRPRLEYVPLDIASQSCDTVVTERKSTLLEVQAVTSGDATISYKWLKDGCFLEEQCEDSILCIRNSDLSSKGTYLCEFTDGCAYAASRPIRLSVNISSVKKVLVDRYSAQPEVPEDSWPPAGASTYVNLALIKPGNIEKAGEYARNTIQGNMDDIIACKERIEYDTVFANLESTTRLLIEGRPGSGKTTLVHRFSKDWANGNPKLDIKNIQLLFLVHLRGFFNDPKITLRDIVSLYYTDASTVDTITREAEESSGEGLCFVLDGLDEYRPKQSNTFISKLIRRLYLPNAVVITASRPAASAQFRTAANKKVEVVGFLKTQVREYVENYPFSEINREQDLYKYLEQHPNIHDMCYLPIHAAMVCYVYDVTCGNLPRTETEVYTDFTTLTLVRTMRRKDDEMENTIKSADDLQEKEMEIFLRICKLGFEATVSSKQVMRKEDICDYFKDVHCGIESMGLITVDSMARKCGFENLYTFLHLTFQEYLAAYHVFKLSEAKQLQVLREHGKKRHMQVVWKFYCGLISFVAVKFCEIINAADKDDLFGVQCAFESQQSATCDYVVQSGESGTLSFQGHFLTPFDLTAIGYVLKQATIPVEKLILDRCRLGIEGVNAFLGEACDRILSIKTLCFHGKACRMQQYKLLNSCLQKMTSIEVFDMANTNLGSKKLQKLTSNLTLPNLRVLKTSTPEHITKRLLFNSSKMELIVVCGYKFSSRRITESILRVFDASTAAFFRSVSSLVEVDLKNTKLLESQVMLVAEGLKEQACCTSLNLTSCSIGDGGCDYLFNSLAHCSALRELFLCKNRIGDCGARALAELLKTQSQISSTTVAENGKRYWKIDMSYNHIGDNGALSLAESLEHLTDLCQLNLKCNRIGDKGAAAVARAIMDKKCWFQIWNHRITENGRRVISDLKPEADNVLRIDCKMLEEAEIIVSNMQDDGEDCNIKEVVLDISKCEVLSEPIAEFCSSVHTLEIMCTIGNFVIIKTETLGRCSGLHVRGGTAVDGVTALSEGLQHCNNLQTLHLEWNGIGADGARALAEGLQHCNNLQTLHLEWSGIGADGAKALAEGLRHCNSLQTLNLEGNGIGAGGVIPLAECLQRCTNLNLGWNCFGAGGSMVFAQILRQCNNLQALNFEGNDIGADGTMALAEGLQYCISLQMLYLGRNRIDADGVRDLAEGLRHCKNLKTLNLEGNSIGADGVRVLAEVLQHCSLQTLNLERNGVGADGAMPLIKCLQYCTILNLGWNCFGTDGSKVLAEGLQHSSNLHSLNIQENSIGTDGAMALAECLQHCKNLRALNLERNDFGTDGARALVEGLQHCTDLQVLKLGGNDIGPGGAEALVKNLQQYNSLQVLNVDWNGIGADGAKALVRCVRHYYNLRTLNLGWNDIGTHCAMALAEGLWYCNKLETLNLQYNNIDADGAKALAENLQHCSNLQMLNLEGNCISRSGAIALSECLQYWDHLRTLNFKLNRIGADGAKALAEGLQHCNLQTLNLDWSEIGADGTKALAKGLQHCTSLRTLSIEWNDIGDDAEALAEGLRHCTSLQTLNLDGNDIGVVGAKAFVDALQHCSTLQTLSLRWNSIGDDGAEVLAEGLQHHKNLQTLNIEQNDIGASGAKALAEGVWNFQLLM